MFEVIGIVQLFLVGIGACIALFDVVSVCRNRVPLLVQVYVKHLVEKGFGWYHMLFVIGLFIPLIGYVFAYPWLMLIGMCVTRIARKIKRARGFSAPCYRLSYSFSRNEDDRIVGFSYFYDAEPAERGLRRL